MLCSRYCMILKQPQWQAATNICLLTFIFMNVIMLNNVILKLVSTNHNANDERKRRTKRSTAHNRIFCGVHNLKFICTLIANTENQQPAKSIEKKEILHLSSSKLTVCLIKFHIWKLKAINTFVNNAYSVFVSYTI